jgi:hypothetical protein
MMLALRRTSSPSVVLLRGVSELTPDDHADLIAANMSSVAGALKAGAIVTLTPRACTSPRTSHQRITRSSQRSSRSNEDLTPIGKELADDALATLLDTQAASLGTLQPAEQADLADLLRTLLRGLGDTPAFDPPSRCNADKARRWDEKDPPSECPSGGLRLSEVLSDVCLHSPGPRKDPGMRTRSTRLLR